MMIKVDTSCSLVGLAAHMIPRSRRASALAVVHHDERKRQDDRHEAPSDHGEVDAVHARGGGEGDGERERRDKRDEVAGEHGARAAQHHENVVGVEEDADASGGDENEGEEVGVRSYARAKHELKPPVAQGAALLHIQVAGVPRLLEAVADGAGDFLRPAGQTHSGEAHRGPVWNQAGRFLCRDEFCHVQ